MMRTLLLCLLLAATSAFAQEDAALQREVQAASTRHRTARAEVETEMGKAKLPAFEAKLVTVAEHRQPYQASLRRMTELIQRTEKLTQEFKTTATAALRQHGPALTTTRTNWDQGIQTLTQRLDKVSAVNQSALALMRVQLNATAWGEKNFATKPAPERYKQLVGVEWNQWAQKVADASRATAAAAKAQQDFEASLRPGAAAPASRPASAR